ncbi:hypothetical protein [Nocardia altamirensis]|uniref:hypothetical protein n=1 Tax=Nocardia altamirensis TaxID=472158 RepID=UPI0008403386|nr:hypothetical protein [Nocardia altamirensis]
MTSTRTAAARVAATAALTVAGFFGAIAPAFAGPFGSGSAAPGSTGPFEYEHQCLSRGNLGIQNGEWADYDCVGSYGAWQLIPRY